MAWKTATDDPILTILRQQIDSYCVRSFDSFVGINVSVYPYDEPEAATRSRRAEVRSHKRYIFSYGDSKVMRVRPTSKVEGVQIHFQRRWCDVTDWLKYLKPAQDLDNNNPGGLRAEAQRATWDQQARWWAANGKTFKIFQLPVEVRELIYQTVIGPKIDIKTIRPSRIASQDTTFSRIPYMGLLLSNKRIYLEASYSLFNVTTYYADSFSSARMIFFNRGRFASVKHLELAFSHFEFLRFFGFDVSATLSIGPSVCTDMLKTMNLKTLTIRFAAAANITAVNWLDGACQKTVVDWIMDAAAPFILRHDVRFTGDVKAANLDRWDRMVGEERAKLEQWLATGHDTVQEYYEMIDDDRDDDGGVLLEESAEQSLNLMRELPPRCRCAVPCLTAKAGGES